MTLSGDMLTPPSADAAELTTHHPPTQLVANAVPPTSIRQTFSYRRRILQLEPGRLQLKLRSDPQVAVDATTMNCEVVGWGVSVPVANAKDIPRVMVRRFLELFSKADSGRLSEQDEAYWIDILDQVDFQAFCVDRAAPHYMEGILVSRHTYSVRIQWHDGERQNVASKVARALDCLNVGDEFGAFVKIGRDFEVLNIENITII